MNQFLHRYGFLAFVVVIALSLVALFRLSSPFLSGHIDSRDFLASVTSDHHTAGSHGGAHGGTGTQNGGAHGGDGNDPHNDGGAGSHGDTVQAVGGHGARADVAADYNTHTAGKSGAAVGMGDFSWNAHLSVRDEVLLPGELLVLDIAIADLAPVVRGEMVLSYPTHLLELVRVNTADSFFNHDAALATFKSAVSRNRGAALLFENTVFNGQEVGQGDFARLYFKAVGVGAGEIGVNVDESALFDPHATPGVIYGDTVSFRIE